jgi:hypothetical protein
MKIKIFIVSILVIILLGFVSLGICNVKGEDNTLFLEPGKGTTILNRKNFPAKTQIDNMDENYHYWVAIASVKGHDSSWNKVLELRKDLENKEKKHQMLKLIGKWEVDLIWPKYYIKKNIYEGRVFDGGFNPGNEPQPMILLVLKVDSKLNSEINKWFREGPRKGFPGMEVEKIKHNMKILARCEIFFP